jgi:hypothetical protein
MARQSREARGFPGLSNGARSEGIRRNYRFRSSGDAKSVRERPKRFLILDKIS